MTLHLPPDLETAIRVEAARLGITPQSFVEQTLREVVDSEKSSPALGAPTLQPIDDWERRLLAIGRDCGVSLSDEALSSEGLYD